GVTNAGTPEPPLSDVFRAPPALPEPAAVAVTALAGMLVVPSVKAAAPLGTHAQTATWVRPGFRTHAVRIVLVVLPALAAVLDASVKLTVPPPVTVTVSASASVAFRVTVPTFEFIWALADWGIVANIAAPRPIINKLRKFLMNPPFKVWEGGYPLLLLNCAPTFNHWFRVRTPFYRFEVERGTSTCVPILWGRYCSPGT